MALDTQSDLSDMREWKARISGVEDTVGRLLYGDNYEHVAAGDGHRRVRRTAGGVARASSSSLDGDTAAESTPTAFIETAWHLAPDFTATLPRVSAAVDRLRAEIAAAVRTRRIAEVGRSLSRSPLNLLLIYHVTHVQSEVADLREELGLLRAEADAEAVARGVAAGDVRAV
jgi:hypothetical protein